MLWLLRIECNASNSTHTAVIIALLDDHIPWWNLKLRFYVAVSRRVSIGGVDYRRPDIREMTPDCNDYETFYPGYGWYHVQRSDKKKWNISIVPE